MTKVKLRQPKVSIIILNWNGLEDTMECLESVKKITYINYEVIVVDNGSTGNDAQVLREKFGDYMRLIENDRNYGYTGGNNIGIRYALSNSQPDYFLLLNNDVTVASDFLDHLVEAAEADASIGIVGPKVYYYSLPKYIQSAGARVRMFMGLTFPIGNKQVDNKRYEKAQKVDYMEVCLLVQNEVVRKVGLFDESYFCYWEDVDYCIRAKRAGYRTFCAPMAKLWHKQSPRVAPWQRALGREKQVNVALHAIYYSTRNRFKFMSKLATKWQYLIFLLFFFGFHLWFTAGVCLIYHRNVKEFIIVCRGVRDGLFNSSAPAEFHDRL